MPFPDFAMRLPDWVNDELTDLDRAYPTVEERMRLAIRLSQLNVQYRTGGPFGAVIFDKETGTPFVPGVNLVTSTHCSVAHAEVVAIILAQQKIGHYDLSAAEGKNYELVASTEPCAMCFGALPWSGVRSLVCGARDEDARRVGFEEGPKLSNWVSALENRGISVRLDVCRDEARSVLNRYHEREGIVYNARLNRLTDALPEFRSK
jgi:tRNA(Arg) A34 adenosine deaminase TadA